MSWTPCWTERCFLQRQLPLLTAGHPNGRWASAVLLSSPRHHLSLSTVTGHITCYSSSVKNSSSTFSDLTTCSPCESTREDTNTQHVRFSPTESLLPTQQFYDSRSSQWLPFFVMVVFGSLHDSIEPSRGPFSSECTRTHCILVQKHTVELSGAPHWCCCYIYLCTIYTTAILGKLSQCHISTTSAITIPKHPSTRRE